MNAERECPECHRVFDLLDEDDAGEFYYGHDCEDPNTEHLCVFAPRTFDHRGMGQLRNCTFPGCTMQSMDSDDCDCGDCSECEAWEKENR